MSLKPFFSKIINSEFFYKNETKFYSMYNLLFINKVTIYLVIFNLTNADDFSIINGFFLLKFFGKKKPLIKRLYVTKKKTYTMVLKISLSKLIMFSFLTYFLKSIQNLNLTDKHSSLSCRLLTTENTFVYYVKNIQIFDEISEKFMFWKFGLYVLIKLKKKLPLNFIKNFKSLGFF